MTPMSEERLKEIERYANTNIKTTDDFLVIVELVVEIRRQRSEIEAQRKEIEELRKQVDELSATLRRTAKSV